MMLATDFMFAPTLPDLRENCSTTPINLTGPKYRYVLKKISAGRILTVATQISKEFFRVGATLDMDTGKWWSRVGVFHTDEKDRIGALALIEYRGLGKLRPHVQLDHGLTGDSILTAGAQYSIRKT